MRSHSHHIAGFVALWILFSLAPVAADSTEPTAYWLSVVDAGVYRVSYDDVASVSPPPVVETGKLGLTHRGLPVPLWVHDGGDGTFGPGDTFEFVGRHLEGDVSFYSEHSRLNRYHLTFDGSAAQRMTAGVAPAGEEASEAPLRARRHLENDALMVRFAPKRDSPEQETWFWQRLSFLEEEPFSLPLDLEGLAGGEALFKVDLKGWSRHRLHRNSPHRQHRIEARIAGRPAGVGDWDGQEVFTLESPPVDTALLHPSDSKIEIFVPKRYIEGETDPMVDLSLLNWIEADYPHDGSVNRPQARLSLDGEGPRTARLVAPSAQTLVVFGSDGQRWTTEADGPTDLPLQVAGSEADLELFAVRDGAFRTLEDVAVDRPSDWSSPERRADYVMIAHHTLMEGTERLADFHRSRGLDVSVIDVRDLYEEFNHGIVHPRAIRDFLAHTQEAWREPAPRFVLLVGDASWDVDREDMADENYADWSFREREGTREGFLKNRSTPYDGGPSNRGLIPTGSFKNAEGHAASDNFFVAFGDDEEKEFAPMLAIGRFPVVEPAELDAIVDKTIRYVEESGVGPWRRQLLWISNEQEYIQKRTDILADEQVAQGFTGARVYPQKAEKSNEEHQERLLDAFAEGQLVVYFHGHGGRYIWRTGPTDYKKNRDLFNLDHLDQLQPSSRLPVILSMTCFSAPFDHPLADSIGEKFLRLPDRGAIAVLAASWRNSPAMDFSRALVEELTRPQTIGEAVLAAKQLTRRRDMIETYNLLGDPAVPVAAPKHLLEIDVAPDAEGSGLRLEASFPLPEDDEFDGRAIVEWQSADGTAVTSQEIEVTGDSLEAVLAAAPAEVEAVTVYAWDEARGTDAIGVLNWAPDPDAVAEEAGAEAEVASGPASP